MLSLWLTLLSLASSSTLALPQSFEEAPISQAFKALAEVCGNDQTKPDNCTCSEGKSFPDDIADLGVCKPIKCTCPEDPLEKVITFFGCANGGVPDCPFNATVRAPWDKYTCLDGTVLDFAQVQNARIRGECVCKNGAKPVCKSTNQLATCPDGSQPTTDVGFLPAFLDGCP